MDVENDLLKKEEAIKMSKEKETLAKNLGRGLITFEEYAESLRKLDGDEIEDSEDEEPEEENEIDSSPEFEINEREKEGEGEYYLIDSDWLKQPKTTRTKLSKLLQSLMGSAMLFYADGNKSDAIKLCLEIIRRQPNGIEPYKLLTTHYLSENKPEEARNYIILTANVATRNSAEQVAAAEFFAKEGNTVEAIKYYSRALRCDYSNVDIHKRRAELLREIGNYPAAIRSYTFLVSKLDGKRDTQNLLYLCEAIAQYHFSNKNILKAQEAMEVIFIKCSHAITSEHINLYLDLLILSKEFRQTMDILTQHCNVEITYDKNDDKIVTCCVDGKIVTFRGDDNDEIDIHCKFLNALIGLGEIDLFKKYSPPLLEEDALQVGDLYYIIGEALVNCGQYEQSTAFLIPLVESGTYDPKSAHAKLIQSYKGMKQLENCLVECERYMSAYPGDIEICLIALEVLKQLGKVNDMLALTKDTNPYPDNYKAEIILHRCKIILSVLFPTLDVDEFLISKVSPTLNLDELLHSEVSQTSIIDEFLNSGWELLGTDVTIVSTIERCVAITELQLSSRDAAKTAGLSRKFFITSLLEDKAIDKSEDNVKECDKTLHNTKKTIAKCEHPSAEVMMNILKLMGKIYAGRRKFFDLQMLAYSAMQSAKLAKYRVNIKLTAILACVMNRSFNEGANAYALLKSMINLRFYLYEKPRMCNLLSAISAKENCGKLLKFLTRRLVRLFSYPLSMLYANNFLRSGSYKYALNYYQELYKMKKSPLLALLISVAMISVASHKLVTRKQDVVKNAAVTLLEYKSLRGEIFSQEIYYNFGRFYHSMEMVSVAIQFYEKAIATEAPACLSKIDLKPEAARNLSIIYQKSDNNRARTYLLKYCTI